LFIHHSGKTGNQRGTSRREDVLDTVLALRRPADYSPLDGAVFEVHFEKARHIHGKDVEPFEARLETDAGGRQLWNLRSLDESSYDRVVRLYREGVKPTEIAEELGLKKSTVSYHLKRAKEAGEVKGQRDGQ